MTERPVVAYRIEGVAIDDRGALTPAVLYLSPSGELLAARDADGLPGRGPRHPAPLSCWRCRSILAADEDVRGLCTACDDRLERWRTADQ